MYPTTTQTTSSCIQNYMHLLNEMTWNALKNVILLLKPSSFSIYFILLCYVHHKSIQIKSKYKTKNKKFHHWSKKKLDNHKIKSLHHITKKIIIDVVETKYNLWLCPSSRANQHVLYIWCRRSKWYQKAKKGKWTIAPWNMDVTWWVSILHDTTFSLNNHFKLNFLSLAHYLATSLLKIPKCNRIEKNEIIRKDLNQIVLSSKAQCRPSVSWVLKVPPKQFKTNKWIKTLQQGLKQELHLRLHQRFQQGQMIEKKKKN